jgi:hypothetical protein
MGRGRWVGTFFVVLLCRCAKCAVTCAKCEKPTVFEPLPSQTLASDEMFAFATSSCAPSKSSSRDSGACTEAPQMTFNHRQSSRGFSVHEKFV